MNLSQDELERLANNPIRGINLVINQIEQNWFDGKVQLNSKTHPAVLMIDLILGTSHGFLNRLLDSSSRGALRHSRNISELSMNMGDEERYGLFGNPATGMVQLAMDVNVFKSIAIDSTEVVGTTSTTYKELIVPKDTVIPINGYDLSVMNGIRIRWNERNGWKAVYDETTNNPLSPISDNLLDDDVRIVGNSQYLIVNIPVLQLSCSPLENISSNVASGCRGAYSFKDNLFGVRGFLLKDSVLTEIRVSFDQDVFDPSKVTLALNVDTVNKKIAYEIPDVYITNGLGVGSIRIYTYTTKGVLVKDLNEVDPSTISPNYQDYRYGAGALNKYSAPFRTASGIAWRAIETLRGGTNPIPFNLIKQRVIDGRQNRTLPITENNLKGSIENLGYSPVKTIDYVTGRKYALTKELPVQDNKGFYSPMSCYVGSHLSSVNDMIVSGVVFDNGDRVTIPHNVLFDVSVPTTKLINQLTKNSFMQMTSEQIVDLLSTRTLVYTPFYYVLDTSDKQVALRMYHLDAPVINHQTFIQSNPSLGLTVGVGSMLITHKENGYLITLVTKSDNAYKKLDNAQVGVQMSVYPLDSSSAASISAKLIGYTPDEERVFQFEIDSRFDVDVNDVIYFNNFKQFGNVQDKTGTQLSLEATFIFTTAGDKDVTQSDIDKKIDDSVFSVPMVGIVETKYKVTFGKRLDNMYSRIRPLVGEAQYKRYDADVPARRDRTEYKRVDGNLVFDETGEPIVEYRAGDIIYNPDGTPSLRYRRDIDVVYENGEPVMLEPRYTKYHWDFIALDGNYMFSKDDYDIQFAQDTKNYLVNVIDVDMINFTQNSLDQTRLYYQPRSKLGFQRVVVNSNYESVLRQDLSFTVTYYLTEEGYRDTNLREALFNSTPREINVTIFGKKTMSVAEVVKNLMQNAGPEVVTVKLSAMAGDSNIDVISNVDDLTGFSVRKRLELSSDGLVSVQEDIDVIFLPHDVRMTTTV